MELFKKDIKAFARGYALGCGSGGSTPGPEPGPLRLHVPEPSTEASASGGLWDDITVTVERHGHGSATFTANGTYTHGGIGAWDVVTVNVPPSVADIQKALEDSENPYIDPSLNPIYIDGKPAVPVPDGTELVPNGTYAMINNDDPDNPIIIYVSCDAHISYAPPYTGGRIYYTVTGSYNGKEDSIIDWRGAANWPNGYSKIGYTISKWGGLITVSSMVSDSDGRELGDSGSMGLDLGIPQDKTYKIYLV